MESTTSSAAKEFARRRNELIAQGCGSLVQVRAIVKAAEREGLLEDEKE